MSDSSLIGSSVADRLDEQQAMKAGVKTLKQLGMNVSNPKGLMRILLFERLDRWCGYGFDYVLSFNFW